MLLSLDFLRENLPKSKTVDSKLFEDENSRRFREAVTPNSGFVQEDFFEDKLLPEISPSDYVLFTYDLKRKSTLRNKSTPAKDASAIDWFSKEFGGDLNSLDLRLGPSEPKANTIPIRSECLRLLCPVTWKSLELMFHKNPRER